MSDSSNRESRIKALLVSLGGSPAPVIFTLNHQKPERICFFVSPETKATIQETILPALRFDYCHYDWIETPMAEGLSECFLVLNREIPALLQKWGISGKDLAVDYTGGTKTMSVALALATIDICSKYSYVGGVERTKEGVGVVLDGRERMWFPENPWDEIAVLQKREASLLFNKARYASAEEVLRKTVEKVSYKLKPLYRSLAEMAHGYDLWDRFKHQDARNSLYKSRDVILTYGNGRRDARFSDFIERFRENLDFLDRVETEKEHRGFLLCLDLIANAKRRAELENKHDDGMARLYRALEALAQSELARAGIDPPRASPDQLPETLKEEYVRKYLDARSGKLKIPLFASYEVLRDTNNDLGKRFFECYEASLRSVLDLRNRSILAHGFDSIRKETFEQMLNIVTEFAGVEQDALPNFPKLIL